MSKILYLTTGAISKKQGGSGLFNYQVIEYFFKKNHDLTLGIWSENKFFSKFDSKKYFKQILERNNSEERNKDESGSIKLKVFNSKSQLDDKCNIKLSKRFRFVSKLFPYFISSKELQLKYKLLDSLHQDPYDRVLIFGDFGWIIASLFFSKKGLIIFGDSRELKHFELFISNFKFLFSKNFKIKHLKSTLSSFLVFINLYLQSIFFIKLIKYSKRKLQNNLKLSTLSPFEKYFYNLRGLDIGLTKYFTPEPEELNKVNIKREGFNIIHVGDLRTTASKLMVSKMIKILNDFEKIYKDNITINLVGHFNENSEKEFQKISKNIKVNFLGNIENIQDIYSANDVFFAPMNYHVGIRTRIISALSNSVPVIAHKSSGYGLIDAINDRDLFLCDDHNDFVQKLYLLAKNPDISCKLSQKGRILWEKSYNPKYNLPLLEETLFS